MLRREALPLYGRKLADALVAPRGEALITLWPTHWDPAEPGEELETSWDAFFDVLRTRRPFRGRFNHPGWTPATFAPSTRTLTNVRAISAVVLSFRPGDGVTFEAFVAAWSDRYGFVFSTNEHSPSAHAFAGVLAYRRPVSRSEHVTAVRNLAALSRAEGRPFDRGALNPARFFYLPGTVPGRPFATRELAGNPIDAQGE